LQRYSASTGSRIDDVASSICFGALSSTYVYKLSHSPAAVLQALASYEASINIANISHDYDWIKVRDTMLYHVAICFCVWAVLLLLHVSRFAMFFCQYWWHIAVASSLLCA
jgi:hypothetical protein